MYMYVCTCVLSYVYAFMGTLLGRAKQAPDRRALIQLKTVREVRMANSATQLFLYRYWQRPHKYLLIMPVVLATEGLRFGGVM